MLTQLCHVLHGLVPCSLSINVLTIGIARMHQPTSDSLTTDVHPRPNQLKLTSVLFRVMLYMK